MGTQTDRQTTATTPYPLQKSMKTQLVFHTVFHTASWKQRSSTSWALSDGVLAIHTDSL